MQNYNLFTSESVSEGHPDKMADQISDAPPPPPLSERPPSYRYESKVLQDSNGIINDIGSHRMEITLNDKLLIYGYFRLYTQDKYNLNMPPMIVKYCILYHSYPLQVVYEKYKRPRRKGPIFFRRDVNVQ